MVNSALGAKRASRPLAVTVVFVLSLLLTGCTIGSTSDSGGGSGSKDGSASVAQLTFAPDADATDISPVAPVSVAVTQGTLSQVALTGPEGKVVKGELSADKTSFAVTEPLGYSTTYTWSGTAIGTDTKQEPLEGSFSTVSPQTTVGANTNIGDGQDVGIAAPIILRFDSPITDKAAVEKALVVTTNPPTVGSWAWLPADNGGARADWRPQNYWAPGTTVDLTAKLYGLSYGDGSYGAEDLSLHFAIGRSQIVKAEVTSHRLKVVREGEVVLDIPVSYGEGNESRNVTRSGIHMVTEKFEDIHMSNPPYYTDAHERWAVRISNNGEFIHANPLTTGNQGASNVTNGCINLSTEDAQTYFGMAVYGDPVEVTGSSIDLSEADGDIYDWAIDWPTWKSYSALDGETASASRVPSTSPGARPSTSAPATSTR